MTDSFPGAASAARTEPRPGGDKVQALFFVTAQADPGIAPRLVEPFSKLGVVPARVHMSTEDGTGEEITADLRASCVSRETAHLIAKALNRIVGVRQVIALSE